MTDKALLQRFDRWRAEGRTLALATVVGTEGSTYTKTGHRILIADSGECEGLVSGGCLEGDLAVHAREVMASGEARVVTYDLRGENEELFGLGVGCDGLLRILLQRLSPAGGYEPFTRIAELLRGDEPRRCHIFCTANAGHPAGTTLFDSGDRLEPGVFAGAEVLHTMVRPLPRLLVLGAGPDAVPLVTIADLLGWRVTLADHRPADLERAAFSVADARLCSPAAALAGRLALGSFQAAVVMSHNLAADRQYLALLAESSLPYIGLLGPPGRRDRLLEDLGPAADATLAGRLHGPAGLDIGADSPESIALSIMSQIHSATRCPP
jgi:xanthine/CO dehydrogenase XdhC/CoxF family maturation factor